MNKLLTIILLLSLSLAFYSCSDDKEEEEEPEKFVWNGDWNNPSDPNYKKEGYNPIVGVWKNDKDGTKGLYFSDDFKCYQVAFYSNGKYDINLFRNKYVINDKAYSLDPPDREFWRYKIENGKFWDTPNLNDDRDWRSYSRVE